MADPGVDEADDPVKDETLGLRNAVMHPKIRNACSDENLDEIEDLLVTWNCPSAILCHAAGAGKTKIIEYVLDKGHSPNECHTDYPINFAVGENQVEAAALLISKGASVREELLSWEAASIGNPEMIEILLSAGAKFEPEDILEAVKCRRWGALEAMVRHGVDLRRAEVELRDHTTCSSCLTMGVEGDPRGLNCPDRSRNAGFFHAVFRAGFARDEDLAATVKLLCREGVEVRPEFKDRVDAILSW